MRLDTLLVNKGFFDSRTKAKQAIERGEIFVDGKIIVKASSDFTEDSLIERKCEKSYVSLGGFKLEKALKDFDFNVEGFVCADLGASTGGFTDCLLKNGAKTVYAVDLNDDLLHETLKNNPNVIRVIKNVKDIVKEDFSNLNLVTADLSFISLECVIPIISLLLKDSDYAIVLIKPQFETGEKKKFKNGIIKDVKIHKSVCKKIYDLALKNNLVPIKLTETEKNKEKNREFLILLCKNNGKAFDFDKYKF